MKRIQLWVISALSMLVMSTGAWAVVPSYISDALTSAQTTFTEYLTAAAPAVFALTILIAAFLFVVKLIKRATH